MWDDTMTHLMPYCGCICASLILVTYLRVICILLYFLCTYNHIEYCITYVTYRLWRHHGNEIALAMYIYCIPFCICHILMYASIPYIPIVSYVFPLSTILTTYQIHISILMFPLPLKFNIIRCGVHSHCYNYSTSLTIPCVRLYSIVLISLH